MAYKPAVNTSEGLWGELIAKIEARIQAATPSFVSSRGFRLAEQDWIPPMKASGVYRAFSVSPMADIEPAFMGSGAWRHLQGVLVITIWYDRKKMAGKAAPGGVKTAMYTDARLIRETLFPRFGLSNNAGARVYNGQISHFDDGIHYWQTITLQVAGYSTTY